MADKKVQYQDVNGNILSSIEAQQPGEIYQDAEGNILPFKSSIPTQNEIGRTLVEGLPFGASFIPGPAKIPVILAATALKTAAKVLRPDLVGEPPQGIEGGTLDMIKELITNALVPKLAGGAVNLGARVGMEGTGATLAKAFRNFPAVRQGAVKNITEQIQNSLGQNYRPASGEFQPLEFRNPVAAFQPTQPIKIQPGSGPEQAFQWPVTGENTPNLETSFDWPIQGGPRSPSPKIPNPQIPDADAAVEFSKTHKIMPNGGVNQMEPIGGGSVERVLKGDLQTGEDKLSPLLRKPKIDAAKALEELSGENSQKYLDAFTPEGYFATKNLLSTMQKLQEKNTLDSVIRYSRGRLVWGGMGAAIGSIFGNTGVGALAGMAARESPVILNGFLDKIMANPTTAKLVTEALTTPANSQKAIIINKALSSYLPRLIQAGADYVATPER